MSLRRFDTFETWVNKARSWMRPGDICIDAKDRRCRVGADFMRARDEGAFPVRIVSEILRDGADTDDGVAEWAVHEARVCESRMHLSFPLHQDAVLALARTLVAVMSTAFEETFERMAAGYEALGHGEVAAKIRKAIEKGAAGA